MKMVCVWKLPVIIYIRYYIDLQLYYTKNFNLPNRKYKKVNRTTYLRPFAV